MGTKINNSEIMFLLCRRKYGYNIFHKEKRKKQEKGI